MRLSRLKIKPDFPRFKRKQKRIRFSFLAPDANEVYLAGDFNMWDDQSLRLKKKNDGTWNASVKLSSGKYEYKYIVDGEWRLDPENKHQVTNPLGSINSLITVSL